MAAYTKDQYAFIVEQLAEGGDADGIAFAFANRWKDTACTAADVATVFRDLAVSGWKAYHDAHRAAFIEGAPAATIDFRVALLDKWAREAASRGPAGTKLAAEHLEQIAKEQGGFYSGKGKADAPPADVEPVTAITRTIIDPKDPDAV